MALFQKKPDTSSPPIYTLGLNRNIMIVGLGNVGKEYDGTRHNIGFMGLDAFVTNQEFDPWVEKRDLKCFLASKTLGGSRVIAVKPTTFMNLSGEAVQAVAQFYKVPVQQILVVHDELDIPFGQIRTRTGGSAAGHNGIKSITQHMGEEYGRVRIGIGPKEPAQMDAKDFVLARFSSQQQEHLPALYKELIAILTEYAYGDTLHADTRDFIV